MTLGLAIHPGVDRRASWTTITGCRVCGNPDLEPFLSLGETPLANALLSADQVGQPEATYPLTVAFCPRCSLVQLIETVAPEALFLDYPYTSSFSDAVLANAREIAQRMIAERGLDADSFVMEIGSNDGYLLQYYVAAGIPALGIEPARNIAEIALARGVPTMIGFFGETVAAPLYADRWRVDVLHANNVLAHIADLNGTVVGIAHLLADDGVAILEVPYVKDMIDYGEFDTIYHEHLCYFSATALDALFRQHGLVLLDFERGFVHGGTLRCFVGKQGRPSQHVLGLLWYERHVGMTRIDYYRDFARRAAATRYALRTLLGELKERGKRIVAYSVPAKGCTLLHYAGIGRETLDYAVDSIPLKQGRYTPGLHLPIFAPERVLTDIPDYCLLLAWNFADVILGKEADYRSRGGKFIIPIPEVSVV